MCSCFFFLLIFSHLIGLRCHQAVQFQRSIKLILERDNRIAVEQQPLALVAVRNIGKLERRDIQLLGKDLPIAGCLVKHINEIAVLKDVLDFPACEQILDVLGDACGYAAPFSEPLPDLDAVCCGLFLFQQEVKLVYIVPGVLFAVAVDGNTVPDLIVIGNPPLLPYLPIW